VVYEKLRLSTNMWFRHRSLVDHHVCDQHLKYHVSVTVSRYTQDPLMGGRATHQWILFIMTQTDDVTQKTNPQKIFDPLIWRPINISPPKVQKPTFWTELYTLQSCKISRRSTLNNCPRAKIHTFLIGDSPGELLSHAIHVRKLPSS